MDMAVPVTSERYILCFLAPEQLLSITHLTFISNLAMNWLEDQREQN